MPDEKTPEQIAQESAAEALREAAKADAAAAAKAAAESVMEGMKSTIGSQVQDALGQFVRDNQPRIDPSDQDPIAKLVGATTRPALERANVISEAARDQSLFFQLNPEAIEHRDVLLSNWQEMFNRNIPLKMEVIWNEYRGKNFDKFHTDRAKKDEEKVQRAKDAEGVSGGSPDRSQTHAGALKDPFASSQEDLTKALENVAF